MNAVALQTHPNPYRRALATNSTASGYTARTDTLTLPANVVDLRERSAGRMAPNTFLAKFIGVGSNNHTGSCRFYGIKELVNSAGEVVSYTHTLLAAYSFHLSDDVGVSGGVVTNSERYADTITRDVGVENVADQLVSPTGDVSGHVLVDCKGHTLILCEPIIGTATSVNVIIAGV